MRCIFLVCDTLRRDYLTAYGNTWVQTPNIQRIAQRGVVFDNHWVGSLPCIPARREFMTGRYNFLFRGWGPLEPFDDLLPYELRKKGVFSHLLTDHFHYFGLGAENYHTAFDTWDFHRGQEYDPWISIVDRVAMPEHLGRMKEQNWKNRIAQQKEEDFSGPRTCMAACDWLKRNGKSDNWFLQLELYDPHEPFTCVEKYRKMYSDNWNGPLFDWPGYEEVCESPEAVEHVRKCYAGLLTMTDVWIGKVLDTLEELKLLDDTLILFTTDHGTLLGEHRYWMKNYMPLYNEIVRIPMIAHIPGVPHLAGTRISALTQSIDIMPSILDMFECDTPPHVHGQSVRPVFFGSELRQDALFGYFGKATNITDGRHVYMRNPINEDGGPLYTYTSSSTIFRHTWLPRDAAEQIEMGRYFGHTYNLPMFKVPMKAEPPRPLNGQPGYVGRHELFDIVNDPRQESPIHDAKLEADFVERMKTALKACEAPAEQFTRLGL